MKRRRFLGIFSLGLAGTALGLVALPNFEKIVKKMIEADTKDLSIEKGAIEKYIIDAKKKNVFQRFNLGKREFIRGHYFIDNRIFALPYQAKYSRYRSDLIAGFLLSTDFFANRMNTGKTIHYTSFYDPYFRPCSNPFSNIYYS